MDADANAAVQELIDRQVASGSQIGVQVAAYLRGKPFVEAVSGTMGPNDPRPMRSDSLTCAFSATKGVAALAIHQLADRGELDYDEPVATYWPRFAQHGKDEITVAQAVSHMAGLHAMPEPFQTQHLLDWDAGIRRMEEAVPAWEPGSAVGYHAVTFGWIVGGIVEGATGRHIQEFMRTEIAEPLGIEHELYCGIPDDVSVLERCTTLEIHPAGEGLPIPDDAPFYEAMPKAMWPHFNHTPLRKACLPSGNGHMTARALARMYAALTHHGELDGAHLVTPERIPVMQRELYNEVDRVIGVPIRRSIGFFLGGAVPHPDGRMVIDRMGPYETAFGHPGAGGPVGWADPESGLAIGVVSNKMAFTLPGEGATVEIVNLLVDLARKAS